MSFINPRYVSLMCATLWMLVSSASPYAAIGKQEGEISVQSELREIGYSVGDIARQTIVVNTPEGYRFEESSLPTMGRTSDFIELRDAKWEFKDTKSGTRHVFILDWQVFQVLQEIKAYPLKPLNLQFRKDEKFVHAVLDPGRIIISSLLPTALSAERLKSLPDIEAIPRSTLGLKSGLFASLFLLLVSMAYFAWYLDWLNIRSASSRPFTIASREIRAIRKNKDSERIRLMASMKTLRRASDMTAGVALSRERLGLLFERNPWLVSLQSDIEEFYSDSETLFFAGVANTADMEHLYKLSLKLRALESRAA